MSLESFADDVFSLEWLQSFDSDVVVDNTLLTVVGGKHTYHINDYSYGQPLNRKWKRSEVAHVFAPPTCRDGSGMDTISIFRDGVRRAAYRNNIALCLCGEYNTTTTFTLEYPITEMPYILNGSTCGCDRTNDGIVREEDINNSQFDFYFPCQFDSRDPGDLVELENCADANQPGGRDFSQVRVFLLHTTTMIDRLSMKHKMWISALKSYGRDDTALVMPNSWNLEDRQEYNMFFRLCQQIVAAGLTRKQVFIMKDVNQHRQYGITLKSADEILDNKNKKGFTLATEFLADPFIVRDYKINIRRYLLVVCQQNRLRAYVHDDGKNIYTRLPYVEPWEGESWVGNEGSLKTRLEELITSGYVKDSHYDDKPLSGLEFFDFVRETRGSNASDLIDSFQRSMWTRLALVVHSGDLDGPGLCATRPQDVLRTQPPPLCLDQAIRFQHFGCDFHVDGPLTGADSRIFECNKGPDMSTHSARDGIMKRDVAADMASFIGLTGAFVGDEEHARRHNMTLIYDSLTFEPETHLQFLRSLQVHSTLAKTEKLQQQHKDHEEL